MKEHPILFSGAMVRAILREQNPKTQTRRVVRFPKHWQHVTHDDLTAGGFWNAYQSYDGGATNDFHRWLYGDEPLPQNYQPGDRLWVKETWADVNTESGPAIAYRSGGMHFCTDDAYPVEYERYPGCEFSMWLGDLLRREPGHAWRPSIHMPRWASRLALEITDVRAQRLQSISEEDALAEGVWLDPPDAHGFRSELRPAFRELWDSLNAKRGLGWAVNPWVFAYTFRRLAALHDAERE